jgi:hypothetical protein
MTNIPDRLATALSGSYRIEREVGVGGRDGGFDGTASQMKFACVALLVVVSTAAAQSQA